MSEVKKIATRESYGNALVELGAEHDNLIVLDADLAAATKTGVFKKAYPDRHIDCGIAECNMMGIAAGQPQNDPPLPEAESSSPHPSPKHDYPFPILPLSCHKIKNTKDFSP